MLLLRPILLCPSPLCVTYLLLPSCAHFPKDCPMIPLFWDVYGAGARWLGTPLWTTLPHPLLHPPAPIKTCHSCDSPSLRGLGTYIYNRGLFGKVNVQSKTSIDKISNKIIGECWSNLKGDSDLAAPIKSCPTSFDLSLKIILGKPTAGLAVFGEINSCH